MLKKTHISFSSACGVDTFRRFIVLALFLFLCLPTQTTGILSADLELGTSILNRPTGIAIDPTSDALFVVDAGNNRVLRFDNRASLTSASSPTMSFGQLTLLSILSNLGLGLPTAQSLSGPSSAHVDSKGTLWVTDTSNNRILLYHNAATLSSSLLPLAANGILGQDSFNLGLGNLGLTFPGPSSIENPYGLHLDGSTLWVTDAGNNRILRFDGVTTGSFTNSSNAAAVVGQITFNDNTSGTSASQLTHPVDAVATSAGLFVADALNNRVVFFSAQALAQTSGPIADALYGQPSFLTSAAGLSSLGLNFPNGLEVGTDGTLFVSDAGNNRVLLYPPITSSTVVSDIAAIDVLGQTSFTSNVSGNTLKGLSAPYDLAYDVVHNCLWVVDNLNNRILRFPHILYQVLNNISSTLDVQMKFIDRTLNVLLQPLLNATNPANTGGSFFLLPGVIEELDAGGKAVQSVLFPQFGYSVLSSIDSILTQIFKFKYLLPGGQLLEADYSFFASAANLESAGIPFHVTPGTLKLSLMVSQWNFTNSTNGLHIVLNVNIDPPVTSIIETNYGNITTYTLLSSDVLNTTITLLHFGVADNTTIAPVGFSLNATSSSPTNSTYALILDFPHFTSSFFYDPDFSVTLAGGGNNNGGGDGSNDSLLPLLALVALVIPIAMVMIAIAVVTFFAVRRWVWKQHLPPVEGTITL